MSIRKITLIGNPILRKKAILVDRFNTLSLKSLVQDLKDTMIRGEGIGLAAPQIGVSLRVFVYILLDKHNKNKFTVEHIINPELTFEDDEKIDSSEGCLSIPDIRCTLCRYNKTVAKGYNMYGEKIIVKGTDLLSRCLQHETDHLNGILFIDKLDRKQRLEVLKIIRESQWYGDDALDIRESPHPKSRLS